MSRRKTGDKVDGWVVLDKPLGHGLDPGGRQGAPAVRRAEGRPWRHARSAGHRRAADRPGRGDQDRARSSWTAARNTASRCASARRARPRTPRARSPPPATCARPTRRSAGALAGLRGRDRADAAGLLGAQGRRQARLRPRAGGRGGRAEAAARRHRAPGAAGAARRGPCRFRGRLRQGHLYPVARAAIWRSRWAPSDTCRRCVAPPSGRSARKRPFRFPNWRPSGIFPPLLGALAPVATALDDIPALALTETQADRLRQGQPVLLTRDAPPSGALLRAETGSKLVALVRSDGAALQPVRVFNL